MRAEAHRVLDRRQGSKVLVVLGVHGLLQVAHRAIGEEGRPRLAARVADARLEDEEEGVQSGVQAGDVGLGVGRVELVSEVVHLVGVGLWSVERGGKVSVEHIGGSIEDGGKEERRRTVMS